MNTNELRAALDELVRTAIEARAKQDYREGATRQEKAWADEDEAEARAAVEALFVEAVKDAEPERSAPTDENIKEHFIRKMPDTREGFLALLERYDDMVRSLCCWLSVGGYNNENPKSPERAEADIRWGVDHLIQGVRAIDSALPAVSPEVT